MLDNLRYDRVKIKYRISNTTGLHILLIFLLKKYI